MADIAIFQLGIIVQRHAQAIAVLHRNALAQLCRFLSRLDLACRKAGAAKHIENFIAGPTD